MLKHKLTLFLLIGFSFGINAQNAIVKPNNTTAFYFIRHAEKDRTDSTNRNPELTPKGLSRAEHWADVLKHIPLDAVYSTSFKRTQQTAAPIAAQNGLPILTYKPNSLQLDELLKKHQGKNVLIVGHSNTVPKLVNQFIGSDKYNDIDDSNNNNLYQLIVNEAGILDTLFFINF